MSDSIKFRSGRRRVLIADFDFFTAIGGGQVFYRRVVERNPSVDFYYPSTGPDLHLKDAVQIPSNAHPYRYDPAFKIDLPPAKAERLWIQNHYMLRVAGIAAPIQGATFQAMDIPSFFPVADLARPVMAAFGITVERIVLGLVGWPSVSAVNGYEPADQGLLDVLTTVERASMAAADVRYTISHAEQNINSSVSLPITVLDMHDAIEAFPPPDPEPPGKGPPDLWYVGRLDGAKAPDLFIELVSRMPRQSYGRCFLTGPDNSWTKDASWSVHIRQLAASRGVQASYEGVLSNSEIRQRVYQGRSVLVVPSRNDAFNYVALEAILNGCPLLLSERTGAFGFLSTRHPHLLRWSMNPDRIEASAEVLRSILLNYASAATELRQFLQAQPFPKPALHFMDPVYSDLPQPSTTKRKALENDTIAWRATFPLLSSTVSSWRAARPPASAPRVTIVIPTFNRPELLVTTLSSVTRQTFPSFEIVVVDDGSVDPIQIRRVAAAFGPIVRLVRTGNAGEAAAVNRGIECARGEFLTVLSDDDVLAPDLLAQSVAVLEREPDAIGTYPDWDIVDTSGYFVEAHRVPEFDRKLMLLAHWCLPGPGAIIRRKIVRNIGGRDLSFRFVSDFDLWMRATKYGRMTHIPHKLAYWRLHASNLTVSRKLREMARERTALIEKFFMDPEENWEPEAVRGAYAAACLAAAAILGRAEPDHARRHLSVAARLAPSLLKDLPINMAGYPDVWPPMQEQV